MILFGIGAIFQKMYQIPFTFESIFFSVSLKYYMFGFVSLTIFLYDIVKNYFRDDQSPEESDENGIYEFV